MWILSTDTGNRLRPALPLAVVLIVAAGCASQTTDLGELEGVESKYAEQREGGAARESDTAHVPPVPHDEGLESVAQEALPEYVRALKAMREQEYQKAIIMLQSLSSRYPRLSGPLVNQGIAHMELEEYEDAEDALKQALDVNSRNPYAHNALGVALREQGKFDRAREHYENAIELDPKYARAHFNMGVLAELYLQDLRLALEHFRIYQNLQSEPDRNVANWITDLERRAPPPPAPEEQNEQDSPEASADSDEGNAEEAS